jgi:signal peptidase I
MTIPPTSAHLARRQSLRTPGGGLEQEVNMTAVALAAVGLVATGCTALWMRRHLTLVTVTGNSMEPTLHQGDRVLVRRRRLHDLARGEVVVLAGPKTGIQVGEVWRAPIGGWHIKRVAALPGDKLPDGVPAPDETGLVPPNTVVVFGDNPIGADSRTWGPYPADGVMGTAIKPRPLKARPMDARSSA